MLAEQQYRYLQSDLQMHSKVSGWIISSSQAFLIRTVFTLSFVWSWNALLWNGWFANQDVTTKTKSCSKSKGKFTTKKMQANIYIYFKQHSTHSSVQSPAVVILTSGVIPQHDTLVKGEKTKSPWFVVFKEIQWLLLEPKVVSSRFTLKCGIWTVCHLKVHPCEKEAKH